MVRRDKELTENMAQITDLETMFKKSVTSANDLRDMVLRSVTATSCRRSADFSEFSNIAASNTAGTGTRPAKSSNMVAEPRID
eukprot:7758268-Heterocapsa_arctica.AAC.1